MKVINNNVFVTRDGNICEKSRKGRRVGTLVGATAAGVSLILPYKQSVRDKLGVKNTLRFFNKFIKNDVSFLKDITNNDKSVAKEISSLSKGSKIAIAAGVVLSSIGLCALVGRGIGKIADKIMDRRHAKQADAAAMADND